jgi:hypothetical protein
LAAYDIWNRQLHHHVEETWESNSICQGQFKIHLHLTSLNPITGCKEILEGNSNTGLVQKKQTYSTDNQKGAISPV